jgi:hypothetical protein
MDRLESLVARLRQWRVPSEFRVDTADAAGWVESLTRALVAVSPPTSELAPPAAPPELQQAPVPDVPTGRGGGEAMDGLDNKFVISLCNDYHRLRRSIRRTLESTPAAHTKFVDRAIEDLEYCLKERGIECRDLTGELYHHGRKDFDPIAPATPVAGLEHSRISACELPLVRVHGRMIQLARGLIERPE